MPAGVASPDIEKKLDVLRKRHGKAVAVEDISEVVESIMTTMKGDLDSTDLEIYNELEALGRYIQDAKSDIAALRPDEVKEQYLPKATDELDAIVQATEIATNTIMDSTEVVEDVMAGLDGEDADKLLAATSAIYEACGFQDITGQRITKVCAALQEIEAKIDGLVVAFGSEIDKVKKEQLAQSASDASDKPKTDEDLLNGPQMTENASSQDEIDALFSSFD